MPVSAYPALIDVISSLNPVINRETEILSSGSCVPFKFVADRRSYQILFTVVPVAFSLYFKLKSFEVTIK